MLFCKKQSAFVDRKFEIPETETMVSAYKFQIPL